METKSIKRGMKKEFIGPGLHLRPAVLIVLGCLSSGL